MSPGELDNWFMTNVLPLEGALVRFLQRHWRDDSEISDLRQETYARIYEAAGRKLPRHAKAFTFMIARNLIIDRVRRARVVSIDLVADYETLPLMSTDFSAEEKSSSRQELKSLQSALDSLPERCREVVVMRKIEGHSQRETANALGIAESTVERQVSKGVRRLADALYGEPGERPGDESPVPHARKETRR